MEFIKSQYPGFIGDYTSDICNSLDKSWGSSFNQYTLKSEELLSSISQRNYSLLLAHGTDALITAFKSLPILKNERIGVPSLTWVATASSIIHAGGIPVFLDVDSDSFTLGLKAIEQIEKNKLKTIAIVHLLGEMVNPLLIKYCKENSIKIVEDSTHVIGGGSSAMENYIGGKVGDVSCFSFQATKTVTAGQGGALVTDNEEIYKKASIISRHGINKALTGKYYWSAELGFNFAISDFQAALIYSQLSKIDDLFNFRKLLIQEFKKSFVNLEPENFDIAPNFSDEKNIPYQPLVKFKDNVFARNGTLKELCLNPSWIKKYNIEVRPSYYPLHLMKPFEKYYLDCPNNLDNSIKNSNSTFLLPFGNRFPLNLVDETIKRVEIVLKEGMIELSN